MTMMPYKVLLNSLTMIKAISHVGKEKLIATIISIIRNSRNQISKVLKENYLNFVYSKLGNYI